MFHDKELYSLASKPFISKPYISLSLGARLAS
jgi:hypothetical protein